MLPREEGLWFDCGGTRGQRRQVMTWLTRATRESREVQYGDGRLFELLFTAATSDGPRPARRYARVKVASVSRVNKHFCRRVG